MKPSDFFESLGLGFPRLPRLQPAGGNAPLQFSAAGGGGDYDDPDDDFYDEYEEEPAPRRRADEERQPTAARRRTVQSEPDDRYWTDYLRIALPVIGLLLVVAVFWFWAQQLIDDPEDDLTPTEAPGLAEVIESPTQAATKPQQEVVATPPDQQQQPQATQAPVVTPTPVTADQEPVDTEPGAADQADGTDEQVVADPEEAEDAPADDTAAGGIAADMDVTVTEGPLNLRSEASTDSDIVTTLQTDDVLTVVSGPEEGESYIWWNVVDQAGNTGWVVEDFIEPAG